MESDESREPNATPVAANPSPGCVRSSSAVCVRDEHTKESMTEHYECVYDATDASSQLDCVLTANAAAIP